MTRTADLGSDGGLERRIAELERKLAVLETTPGFINSRGKGGTTYWADINGTDQVRVGLLADGTYGIKIGSASFFLQATGASAGQIIGLINLIISGALTAPSGVDTGSGRKFQFTKTSSTRLDITTT